MQIQGQKNVLLIIIITIKKNLYTPNGSFFRFKTVRNTATGFHLVSVMTKHLLINQHRSTTFYLLPG